jgi:hypothetical protein
MSKGACEADSHHIAFLQQSRCASRGLRSSLGGVGIMKGPPNSSYRLHTEEHQLKSSAQLLRQAIEGLAL